MAICRKCPELLCVDRRDFCQPIADTDPERQGAEPCKSVQNGRVMIPIFHTILNGLGVPEYDNTAIISDSGITFTNGRKLPVDTRHYCGHEYPTEPCRAMMEKMPLSQKIALFNALGLSLTADAIIHDGEAEPLIAA